MPWLTYLQSSLILYSLPSTSAVKMIDVWLLFTLFVPFVEILIHTKLVLIKEDQNQESSSAVVPLVTNGDVEDINETKMMFVFLGTVTAIILKKCQS